jgi:hypothetical protein
MSDDESISTDRVVQALLGDSYRQDTYHKTLGEFIAEFAVIEAIMQMALRHFAGVSNQIGAAIFSGVRVDAASNQITRIADAQNWPQDRKDQWKFIVDQLSHIRKLRNDIVHYGAVWRGSDVWIASNQLFAHTADKITNLPASPSVLNDAKDDLRKIGYHIVAFTWPERIVHADAEYHAVLKSAWRYKPPPQAGRPQTPRDKSQVR